MTEQEIRASLQTGLETYIAQYCQKNGFLHIWEKPVIGFADAQGEAVRSLPQIVGQDHILPEEVLPGATIVVSYFLPFQAEIAASNVEGRQASKEWAAAYCVTNEMAAHLNEDMVRMIVELGYHAVVPKETGMIRERISSKWSQRHIAFAAGLGTFGLNNMLIGEHGCCGRYFSLVTDLPVHPFRGKLEEYCLFKREGRCKLCMQHCVASALHEDGFNRKACLSVCEENEGLYPGADVCGKCIAGMPCAFKRP